MSRTKITFVGAGSVIFAKRLIGDLLQFPALAEAEICVMDIDAQRLKVAEKTARKIAATLQVGARVTATLDRTEAIRGAKYVICTIQVGGYRPSTVRDFEIPAKYGLRQTIADTLGVGGVFRGLRTIPKILEIARDIADVGHPDCLFLNYTNPMAMNCWAVDREVGIPHVGLCHSVQGTSQQLSNYAELPYEDVTYLVAGINHMAFFLKFEYRGQDAYPLLFRALENPQVSQLDAVRFEMMRRTGYFVTESSEHQSEYVPFFIQHGDEVIKRFHIPINEYCRRCEAILATWEEEERKLLGEGEGRVFEVAPQSHEYGAYIVHARETHQPTVIYGNVPNRGLISNLREGCCVEVPCLVDGNGIQPTRIGELPAQLAALCMSNVAVQELTVEAALTARRESIYHAVMMDPHTSSVLPLGKIWEMCDELIEAHQDDGFLGEFAPTIRNTGRGWAGVGDRILAQLDPDPALEAEAAGEGLLRLSVENPGNEARQLHFRLDLPEEVRPGAGMDERTLTVKVGAGEAVTRDLPVSLTRPVDSSVRLGLQAQEPGVFCRDGLLIPRRTLEPDEEGHAAFQLKLAGEKAVEGCLRAADGCLQVGVRAMDSDPSPLEIVSNKVRGGSRIELVVLGSGNRRPTSVFLVPESGEQEAYAADAHGEPLSGIDVDFTSEALCYTIRASIPLSIFEIGENSGSLLLDVRCSVAALGDAHSGGFTSLTGIWERGRALSNLYRFRFCGKE